MRQQFLHQNSFDLLQSVFSFLFIFTLEFFEIVSDKSLAVYLINDGCIFERVSQDFKDTFDFLEIGGFNALDFVTYSLQNLEVAGDS